MFHVGQFCECIADGWAPDYFGQPEAWPQKGSVYRVRDYGPDRLGSGCMVVWIAEITGALHTTAGFERGWDARAFRPLQDSKLEVFRALLVDLPALPKFEPTKERV